MIFQCKCIKIILLRSSCPWKFPGFCKKNVPTVKDVTLWRWKKELMEKVNNTLLGLGFLDYVF